MLRRHRYAIWQLSGVNVFSTFQLDKRAVERVCIVGSGDSLDGGTMCRRPGWGNTHICFVTHCKRGIFFRLI